MAKDESESCSNYSDDMNVVKAVSKIKDVAPRGSVAYRDIVGRDSIYFDPFAVENAITKTAPQAN